MIESNVGVAEEENAAIDGSQFMLHRDYRLGSYQDCTKFSHKKNHQDLDGAQMQ